MIISVQSTDPESYNTVRTNFEVPWKCEYVKYYVSSMNTRCNILAATKEDNFKITLTYHNIEEEEEDSDDNEELITEDQNFTFSEFYPISSFKNLEKILNQFFANYIKWEYDYQKRVFKMTPLEHMIIHEPSHRIALFTGLYNTKFPFFCRANETYVIQDTPILYHTKLYLVSLQGNPMYANIGEQQYTPSIIGNIDTVTLDKEALIYNFEKEGKPLKIKTYTDSLKNLEISLVDFQFQPVALTNPLNLCIKIKPAKDVDVKDILTK